MLSWFGNWHKQSFNTPECNISKPKHLDFYLCQDFTICCTTLYKAMETNNLGFLSTRTWISCMERLHNDLAKKWALHTHDVHRFIMVSSSIKACFILGKFEQTEKEFHFKKTSQHSESDFVLSWAALYCWKDELQNWLHLRNLLAVVLRLHLFPPSCVRKMSQQAEYRLGCLILQFLAILCIALFSNLFALRASCSLQMVDFCINYNWKIVSSTSLICILSFPSTSKVCQPFLQICNGSATITRLPSLHTLL